VALLLLSPPPEPPGPPTVFKNEAPPPSADIDPKTVFEPLVPAPDGAVPPGPPAPIVTEIGERVEIITDLMYNEVELSSYKEFGDYWSKGITYYLN
jgi:hypothetical protein